MFPLLKAPLADVSPGIMSGQITTCAEPDFPGRQSESVSPTVGQESKMHQSMHNGAMNAATCYLKSSAAASVSAVCYSVILSHTSVAGNAVFTVYLALADS